MFKYKVLVCLFKRQGGDKEREIFFKKFLLPPLIFDIIKGELRHRLKVFDPCTQLISLDSPNISTLVLQKRESDSNLSPSQTHPILGLAKPEYPILPQ